MAENTSTALVNPALEQEASALVTRASNIQVVDQASLDDAGEFLRRVKTLSKQIDSVFDPAVSAAHAAHKASVAAKAKVASFPTQAEMIVKSKVSTYLRDQERIRQEKERALREQAQREEEERRLAEAEKLEKEGKTEEAEAAIEAPIVAPPVVVPATVEQVKGVGVRKTWKFRIDNSELIPRGFLMPDEKKIAQYGRMMGDTAAMPGVTFYADDSVAVKGY